MLFQKLSGRFGINSYKVVIVDEMITDLWLRSPSSCAFQGSQDEVQQHLESCKFEGVKVNIFVLEYQAH